MQNEHVLQERTQLEHLNRVLRAIRNVNQLIVREKDRERLIRQACELLVETRGFNGAWIALPGEPPAPIIAAQSGFPQAVFADHIQRIARGDPSTCMQREQAGETVVLAENTPLSCADCPLARFYDGAAALIACLAHAGETYGWLGVSVPASFAADPEERNLLAEIAGDLAFALHVIKLDEQRQQTEETLRQSEEQFKSVFEAANVGKSITQIGGQINVNKAFADMLGYTQEELRNKTWQELTPADEIEPIQARLAPLLEGREDSTRFNKRYIHKNGDLAWADVSVAMQRDAGGRPLYFIATVIDITARIRAETERQQAQEALRASEVRYRRLFESAKDGILILDAESGMILDVNPFLVELLGFSHEQFLGKAVWELGAFTDIIANQANFVELQQKEYIRYEDMPLETAAGRRIHVEFVSNVYQVNHRRVIQCNVRDITARKQAEAQLNEQLDELRRWHAATLGREGRIMELKREVNDLLSQAGQPPRYPSAT